MKNLTTGGQGSRYCPQTLLALAALLLVCAANPAVAHAAAFDVSDTSWEGCSELYDIARAELGSSRVKAVGVLDWDALTEDDGVLILHPLQTVSAADSTAFMKAGGRLAVLDDYGRGDEILRRFKIERGSVPSRPVAALRNNPQLAIAEPVIETVAGKDIGPHPVVNGVQRVVTNHATGLLHPDLSPVLRIRAIGEPDAIVAVAGQVENGRLFAMSDPSATINHMLRYPGNRAFAARLVRYLVNDGDGRGRGDLYIVSNRFDEEGAFGGETTLSRDLETQLSNLSAWLEEAREHGLPGWLHTVIAALALLVVGYWVVRSSTRPYKSPLPRYARPVSLVAQGGVVGRFAMLSAPSSPRSLALLELKSALFEALAYRFELGPDPSAKAIEKAVRSSGLVDDTSLRSLAKVMAVMQQAEGSVVAGRPMKLGRPLVREAAQVVEDVLAACGAGEVTSRAPLRPEGGR
jgi:hypothetical protein